MRKVAALLLVTVFSGSNALGGVVEFSKGAFDPSSPSTVNLTVTILADSTFTGLDLVIFSNDVPLLDYTFTPDLLTNTQGPLFPGFPTPTFPENQLFIGGNGTTFLGPVVVVGTLTVDPTGLGLTSADVGSQLTVFVDGNMDGTSKLGGTEILTGTGFVNVVPEPATLSLMALAAAGFIHRRRRTA